MHTGYTSNIIYKPKEATIPVATRLFMSDIYYIQRFCDSLERIEKFTNQGLTNRFSNELVNVQGLTKKL